MCDFPTYSTQKWNFENSFVPSGRSYVTPTMAIRSICVDMAVKWWVNLAKQTEFAHGGLLWNFIWKPTEHWSHILWNWTPAHKIFTWAESPFYYHVNSWAPSGHHCSYSSSPASYNFFNVRFKVFTMIRMILVLFGVLVPCCFVDQCQHLRDTYCLHLQADVIKLGSERLTQGWWGKAEGKGPIRQR